jgi:lysozyme family protein
MANNFDKALAFTLLSEGLFSNDPNDPGGATMYGIILAEYQRFKGDPSLGPEDLKQITIADRDTIYKQNYWLKTNADALPTGVDLSIFDMAVTSGPTRSIKILQEMLGVMQDGLIGPNTFKAITQTDPVTLLHRLYIGQAKFYRSLATFKYFGNGWINRTAARLAAANHLAEPGTAKAI